MLPALRGLYKHPRSVSARGPTSRPAVRRHPKGRATGTEITRMEIDYLVAQVPTQIVAYQEHLLNGKKFLG